MKVGSLLAIAGLFALASLPAIAARRNCSRRRGYENFNRLAMIEAIADVETGNTPNVMGRRGERGRCQFLPSTWRCYTEANFRFASQDCALTRSVERAHLSAVCRGLEAIRAPFDPALIAAAWRHGLTLAARFQGEDAAQRAATLYYSLVSPGPE